VAILEVENEQLQFMKSIRHFDADKPEDEQRAAETSANTPLDLGFPEEEDCKSIAD